jgi:hypothetical protein
MYSDPGQDQTYHDFDGLTFNFFNWLNIILYKKITIW